eukprot:5811451-Amphidinium_carterae.1
MTITITVGSEHMVANKRLPATSRHRMLVQFPGSHRSTTSRYKRPISSSEAHPVLVSINYWLLLAASLCWKDVCICIRDAQTSVHYLSWILASGSASGSADPTTYHVYSKCHLKASCLSLSDELLRAPSCTPRELHKGHKCQ